MSLPEIILWRALKARPDGLKFRKQHPAGDYTLDFFCASGLLCVEVDGEAHECGNRPDRDAARDAWIAAQGVRTFRIPAIAVMTNLEGVLQAIVAVAKGADPSDHTSP